MGSEGFYYTVKVYRCGKYTTRNAANIISLTQPLRFLSNAYVVSPEPTSRNLYMSFFLSFCLSFCIQFASYWSDFVAVAVEEMAIPRDLTFLEPLLARAVGVAVGRR